jgi:hypothetical protein
LLFVDNKGIALAWAGFIQNTEGLTQIQGVPGKIYIGQLSFNREWKDYKTNEFIRT